MPSTISTPQARPNSAPAYYLARPASAWITALHRRPPQRPAGSGQTFPSARKPR
jgi:hypothetical protein